MSKAFFNGNAITDAKRIRQMRKYLCSYLKGLNTGTANGENDPKPELQNIDVLKQLKTSDTYRSKVMHQTRLDLITGPSPKRLKRDDNNLNSSDAADDGEIRHARAVVAQGIGRAAGRAPVLDGAADVVGHAVVVYLSHCHG